jgi:hypothetical protein
MVDAWRLRCLPGCKRNHSGRPAPVLSPEAVPVNARVMCRPGSARHPFRGASTGRRPVGSVTTSRPASARRSTPAARGGGKPARRAGTESGSSRRSARSARLPAASCASTPSPRRSPLTSWWRHLTQLEWWRASPGSPSRYHSLTPWVAPGGGADQAGAPVTSDITSINASRYHQGTRVASLAGGALVDVR